MSEQMRAPFRMHRLGVLMQSDLNIPEEVEGVLNPAAVRGRDGELYLLPRIVGEHNRSRVGLARVVFDAAGDPADVVRLGYALEPEEPYELRPEGTGGCEDPRVTLFEPLDTYLMAYSAWGAGGPRIAAAASSDLFEWRRLGLVDFDPDPDPKHKVDFDEYHNKDAAFFPRPVVAPDGRESLAMLHRPVYTEDDVPHRVEDPRPSIWISYCPLDELDPELTRPLVFTMHHVVIDPEFGWEDLRIGTGTAPVATPHGWLTIYHGVTGRIAQAAGEDNAVTYSAGVLLLDERDPRKVLYRPTSPTLAPETGEEREGVVPNVVFPTGIDDRGGGRMDVYYGMADSRIGVARFTVPDALPVS
ncbi:MAG: glycosidase [Chloroflexia bacterium]